MAVLLDSTSGDATSGTAVQTFTYNQLTIGTIPCTALVVILNFALKTVAGFTCTWNGVSCTAIPGASGIDAGANGFVQLFGLLSPASGNKSLVVNWTGVTQLTVSALSFKGVNQTDIATAFPNGTSATGSSLSTSLTITSALDHAVVASHVNPGNAWTAVNNNQIFVDNTPALIDCAANWATGAATVNMTATATSGTPSWVSVGTDIAPDPLFPQIWM